MKTKIEFTITNELLNRGFIVPNILSSEVERTIGSLLSKQVEVDHVVSLYFVCFGRGDEDWIVANGEEVSQYLSNDCVNYVYPIDLIIKRKYLTAVSVPKRG